MKKHSKLLCLVLSLVLLLSLAPAVALAASVENCSDPSCAHKAAIGTTHYDTLAEALTSVQEGQTIQLMVGTISEGELKLPATLKNVTIKGADGKASILKDMSLRSADGTTLCYEDVTFDGIVFDNTNIVIVGWRSGTESYKNWKITNCEFKNIVRTSANEAAVHFNVDGAKAPLNGFEFTNNVIDGVSGGDNSGIYATVTGEITIKNNTINNVAFRPYLAMFNCNDSVEDSLIVEDNTFSGSAKGRAQASVTTAGNDKVTLKVNRNIFKDITDAQQICYWNFNADNTTADLSNNYYDIDLSEKPNRIYFNNAASSAQDLKDYGVYPLYAGLTSDGKIDETSKVTTPPAAASIDGQEYYTFVAAIEAAQDGQTVKLLKNVVIRDDIKGNNDGILTITGNKQITIDGNGHTITANQTTDSSKQASAFNVEGGANVTFLNLTINGNKKAKHGINVFEGEATLKNVTLKNLNGHGMVVQGEATAEDLTASDNGWGGVNVDIGSANITSSSFTLKSGNVQSVIVEHTNTDTSKTTSAAIKGGTVGLARIQTNNNIENAELAGASLKIFGGTFITKPNDAYLESGYMLEENSDGTISAVKIRIIEGEGQIWTKGSENGLRFKSNADFDELSFVSVDGVEEADKLKVTDHYTKQEGSTIVTLLPDYLNTLTPGQYTLYIVSERGTADTTFTITTKGVPGVILNTPGDNANADNTPADTTDAADNKADPNARALDNVPKTADNGRLPLWAALILVSALAGAALCGKRRRAN